MAGEVDLDGRARIRGGIVDRGAYEVPLTLYVATNGLNVAPYTNLATAATAIQTALTAAASGDQVLVRTAFTRAAAIAIFPLVARPFSLAVSVWADQLHHRLPERRPRFLDSKRRRGATASWTDSPCAMARPSRVAALYIRKLVARHP
jgi:hypothetical protein